MMMMMMMAVRAGPCLNMKKKNKNV